MALKGKRKLVSVAHPSELVLRGGRTWSERKQDDSQAGILNFFKVCVNARSGILYDEYGPIATWVERITACCLLFSEPRILMAKVNLQADDWS